jgi:hypothetical protein
MTSSGPYLYSLDVEGPKDMLLAFEKLVRPAIEPPGAPERETASRLNIAVIFTSVESTLAALRQAGKLAASLGARITLLVPQVVPYPLPLESPPVLLDWNERRFRVIAAESSVETVVRLYLCRDSFETLRNVLRPKSLVVIGARKGWRPFALERRLASHLRRAGHELILSEVE